MLAVLHAGEDRDLHCGDDQRVNVGFVSGFRATVHDVGLAGTKSVSTGLLREQELLRNVKEDSGFAAVGQK